LISRLTNSNSYTEVISAKDDTIYMLQIKLVDAKDNSPISGIQINVNGKRTIPKSTTTSQAKPMKPAPLNSHWEGNLSPGIFSAEGSTDYILPSPFFYELKSVGTTMLTVNLSKNRH